MARSVPLYVVVVLAVVVLGAGIGLGYGLKSFYATPSANGGGAAPSVVTILAAGTLGVPFAAVASYLANSSGGSVVAPTAAQQYEGSLAVMAAISQLHQAADVVGSADFRLIPQNLEPTYAGWEAVFATAPEALVYDPSVGAYSGINTTNWPQKLWASGLPLGIANASTDPNGYNEIFVLELQGLLQNGSLSALYDHYFTTPVGSYAIPNPSTTRVEPESNVASLITTHAISSFITYRSYAVAHGLSFVNFDPAVGLGATDAVSIATYGHASTTIQPASGPIVLHGAPVLFSVTIPLNAHDSAGGLDFIHVLLSPAGSALLSGSGLTPIFPAWADHPTAAPMEIAPDVIALPAPLAALLGP